LLDAAQLLEATTTELTRIVRRYRDEIEDDPERLGVLDERLDLLGRLRRKYGDTLEDVIAYAAGASSELERLTGEGYSTERLEAREHELLATLGQETAQLSVERRGAAAGLVEAVSAELTRQGMESASLAIGFGCEDAADGILSGMPDYEVVAPAAARDATGGELVARAFSESGVDRIEFLASFNVGESPRSLGSVASGGETSRFLLALTTVLGSSAEPGTIVLDEVDEGVGGRSGALVGDALARLAEHHQVLCITHLPQVAARADSHFVVSKQTDGQLTWSEIRAVNGEDQITELAAMLGGNSDANRTAAVELLGSHEGAETRA
ncbi:MAG TPA: hypothetical protein QGF35_06890, partial [Dehalococcoidia bacterium]|nr:hypothetical protein [Dehalococcoidia bacterium]